MILIGIIGNCQMLSLCFFLQKWLGNQGYDIRWICYSDEFQQHFGVWSDKCKKKILNPFTGIDFLKRCDYIVYQHIKKETSLFFHYNALLTYKKDSCKMISVSKIYITKDNTEESLDKLKNLDKEEANTIQVSNILDKHNNNLPLLLLNKWHPTTFLFLEIMKELCTLMDAPFLSQSIYQSLIKQPNIMGLPV
jgi:hypothetical protein